MRVSVQRIQELAEIEIIINCPEETNEVRNIVSKLNSIDGKVQGRINGEYFQLSADDILYIDSVDRKTFLYSESAIYETDKRLYELETSLKHCSFFRVSKSIIINLKRVKSLRPEIGSRLLLTMDNDEKIIASRQYSSIIKQTLEVN